MNRKRGTVKRPASRGRERLKQFLGYAGAAIDSDRIVGPARSWFRPGSDMRTSSDSHQIRRRDHVFTSIIQTNEFHIRLIPAKQAESPSISEPNDDFLGTKKNFVG